MNKTIRRLSITIESFDKATFGDLVIKVYDQLCNGDEMVKGKLETCDCDSVEWEITEHPVKIVEE